MSKTPQSVKASALVGSTLSPEIENKVKVKGGSIGKSETSHGRTRESDTLRVPRVMHAHQ